MLQLWLIANTILWPIMVIASGVTISLSELLLLVSGILWFAINRRISVSSVKASLLFLAYFVFSFVIAATGPCTDGFSKSFTSAAMLAFFILLGWEIGRKATPGDWAHLQKTAIAALIVAFAAFFLEFMVPSLFPLHAGARYGGKLSGLYHEPSHVGFSLFPCIVILLTAESRRMRQTGVVALVGLLLVSRSSTLLAFVVAWALYRLLIQRKLRQALFYVGGIALLVAIGSAINYDRLVQPTIDRVVGVSDANDLEAANASSLVYLQGWEDAWANLQRTHGLGLGFNMMGCHPLPDVPARALIFLVTNGSELNSTDGSVLFIKVVCEAGVFGIAFYIAVIWWWFRLERKLRLYGAAAGHFAATTQAALIFCFVVASFVRSQGYFTGTFLLWVLAVSGASKWQQSLPGKPPDRAAAQE